jgi:acyl-CoA synthetase (AMP-forming)/AMP-acid ligase II
LIGPNRRISYGEYETITNQIAHYLLSQGIKKGDRIAMFPEANITFPLFYFAAAKIGAIMVPINWRWSPDLITTVLNEIEPKMIFYDGSFKELVQSLRIPVQIPVIQTSEYYDLPVQFENILRQFPSTYPNVKVSVDDPIVITYTSGSTGKPKGVVTTHKNIQAAAINNNFMGTNYEHGGRILFVSMLTHISATSVIAYQGMVGLTLIFLPEMHPTILLDTIEKEKVNWVFMVPPLLRLLLPIIYKSDHSLASLKEINTGGSPVPRSLIREYEKLGFNITQTYGCTEATGAITYWHPSMGLDTSHSVGKAFLYEIAILDRETREKLPTGEVGELAVRGPAVFKEYWKDPEATKKALHDGWLLTGDAAYIDEKGFVYIVDRYKDVIFFGGMGAIFPSKVEAVIRQLDSVADVAVVGVKHETWGEIPCAFIVPKPDQNLTREQVFAHVYSQLPKHNLADLIFVQELPRNALGKVDKPQLRKLYRPQSTKL